MKKITKKNAIKTYKAFDENMKCKDFQYEIGKEYTHKGDIKICHSGFHACENPIDIFEYYAPTSIFCEVEQFGNIETHSEDSKVCSSKIKIKAEVNLFHIIKIGVEKILSKVDFTKYPATNTGFQSSATNTGFRSSATNTGFQSVATNTGEQSAATNTGYQSSATNTGKHSVATNTGNQSSATNTGEQSVATNTGFRSSATNTGEQSAATNTGDQSSATNTGYQSSATNTGFQSAATVEGKESIACGLGIKNKAKACLNSWIVLTEWEQDDIDYWHIKCVKSAKVDGKRIKENVFYCLKNGKFTIAD